ncbi:transposase, partial [Riemerella columbipharyngis]
ATTELELRFKRHLKANYRHFIEHYTDANEVQRLALAKACAVLDFILEEKETYPGTKLKLYKDLSPILKEMDLQYIPHNYLRLKEKVEILETTDHAIPEIIRLPRLGNDNAEVYNDPVVFGWAMNLRANGANFTDMHIIRQIWEACERTGRRKPSARWFGQKIFEQAETDFLTAQKRYGSSKKANVHKSYIPFKDAFYAGDCWEVDATRVNIIAHATEDEKGNKIERHLMVIVVRDVMSGDVLGYDFTHAENHASFVRAMKMAVQTAGYLPYELVTDRFPGHNTEQIKRLFERLEAMGTIVTLSHNAKQKAGIERWFGTFQNTVLMGSKYYYGEGITSTRLTAHRSPEYIAQLKKESKKAGFDVVAAYTECETLIEQWRDIKYSYYSRKHANLHKTPKELHKESEKPNVIFTNRQQVAMLFDLKKEVTVRNNGQFHLEIHGVKFYYQIAVENYEAIAKTHNKRVIVSYDLDDLSSVFLWKAHGNLLVSICEAEELKQIVKYGPGKDLGRIAQQKARERQIETLKESNLDEYTAAANEEELLLGIHTNKQKANAFEDYYHSVNIPLKKVSGSDIVPDDFDENSYLKERNY